MSDKWSIKRADDISALFNFRCGVKAMDDFIHDKEKGLAKYIELKLSKLWLVYEGEEVVAFFALSKDALVLNSQDRNIIEKDKNKSSALPAKEENVFWEQEKYPAIEIDYLAVREDKRTENNCNLGSTIIESIAHIAANDNLTSTLFLTVEALHTDYYSTIGFYKKCNFAYSEKDMDNYEYNKRYGTTFTTRRMYKIIIPNN